MGNIKQSACLLPVPKNVKYGINDHKFKAEFVNALQLAEDVILKSSKNKKMETANKEVDKIQKKFNCAFELVGLLRDIKSDNAIFDRNRDNYDSLEWKERMQADDALLRALLRNK